MEPHEQCHEHERRLALLEKQFELFDRAMSEKFDDLKTSFKDSILSPLLVRLERIEHILEGNGNPGLTSRVLQIEQAGSVHCNRLSDRIDEIEKLHQREAGAEAAQARAWEKFKPFIPYIIAIVGLAAMAYHQQHFK